MIAIKSMFQGSREVWVLVVGVVLVVLLVSVIIAGPVRNHLSDLEREISESEQQLSRNLRILAATAKKVVEDGYQQYGAKITKKGSSDEENSRMLSELDRLAGENKLTLLATKPQQAKPDRDFEIYRVEIDVESEITALMAFIYGIETSEQLLRIEKLNIDTKGGGVAVKASLTISKMVTLGIL